MQRADDIAACVALAFGFEIATALEHDGLTVAADVGDQLYVALVIANQRTAFVFVRQCVVVANFWDGHRTADITWAFLEDEFHLALEQRFVKVARNW